MPVDLDATATEARELIAWADGYEETNEQSARRVRAFCRVVLSLLDELDAERSCRIAMQDNYNRCLDVIGSRLYQHAVLATRNGDHRDLF